MVDFKPTKFAKDTLTSFNLYHGANSVVMIKFNSSNEDLELMGFIESWQGDINWNIKTRSHIGLYGLPHTVTPTQPQYMGIINKFSVDEITPIKGQVKDAVRSYETLFQRITQYPDPKWKLARFAPSVNTFDVYVWSKTPDVIKQTHFMECVPMNYVLGGKYNKFDFENIVFRCKFINQRLKDNSN
jgi:hypothetical protein